MKKTNLYLNIVHFFSSIIVIEFPVADYGWSIIVCQDNLSLVLTFTHLPECVKTGPFSLAQPFTKLDHTLLMTGMAEMPTFA